MTWSWRQARLGRPSDPAPRIAPRDPRDALRPTRPDKLSIWPVEDERFGVDVLYHGPQGLRRAEVVRRQLEAYGVACTLIEEPPSGWVVRFGPVGREAMLAALNGYVW